MEKYTHPIIREVGDVAKKVGGHGGMDYIMDYRLVYCLLNGLPLDMDVYDLAEWCALTPLSEISIANGSPRGSARLHPRRMGQSERLPPRFQEVIPNQTHKYNPRRTLIGHPAGIAFFRDCLNFTSIHSKRIFVEICVS